MTKLFTRTISIQQRNLFCLKRFIVCCCDPVGKEKRKSISMGQGGRQREKSNLILCLNVFVSCLFQNVLSQLIPFKDHFDNIFYSRGEKNTHHHHYQCSGVFTERHRGFYCLIFVLGKHQISL